MIYHYNIQNFESKVELDGVTMMNMTLRDVPSSASCNKILKRLMGKNYSSPPEFFIECEFPLEDFLSYKYFSHRPIISHFSPHSAILIFLHCKFLSHL